MSKITFNIHNKMTYNRDYSHDEKIKLDQDIDKINPAYVMVMDYPDLAAKQASKGRKIIYRNSHARDGDIHNVFTPTAYYNQMILPYAELGYIVQVYNEPKVMDLQFLTKVMDIAGTRNQSLVVYNSGTGTPDVDHLDDLKPLWDSLKKWNGLHYLGIHEYGLAIPDKPFSYNESSNHDVIPWHIGRTNTFVLPYLKVKHGFKPRVMLTEFGIDDIYPGQGFKRFWGEIFNEGLYADRVIECVKNNYLGSEYEAVCLSFYGNTGHEHSSQNWRLTDVSGTHNFIDIIAGFNRSKPVPPVPPVPPIPPVPTEDSITMLSIVSNNRKHQAKVGISNSGKIIIEPM